MCIKEKSEYNFHENNKVIYKVIDHFFVRHYLSSKTFILC